MLAQQDRQMEPADVRTDHCFFAHELPSSSEKHFSAVTGMPKVISFKEALEATEGEDRALLIGNGFSAQYFTYSSLLAESGIDDGTPLRNLFSALQTADFEAVVSALEGAVLVERAYGNEDHAKELDTHAQQVREALVRAVNKTHPAHRQDLAFQYESSAKFIENFGTVFSVNYDLLLYWVSLENVKLRDGFGLGKQQGPFIGPFVEGAYCEVFNLHGGLHLFDDGTGDIMKALDSGDGVIATISDAIANKRRFPVYVAEGNSVQKMKKINSIAYLRHCYEMLRANSASVFIYGHSADENDAHIYRAMFESEAKHIYFGVFEPDENKLKALDGILAKYQKSVGASTDYSFYDSESAAVWKA